MVSGLTGPLQPRRTVAASGPDRLTTLRQMAVEKAAAEASRGGADAPCAICGGAELEVRFRVEGEAGPDGLIPTTDRFGTAPGRDQYRRVLGQPEQALQGARAAGFGGYDQTALAVIVAQHDNAAAAQFGHGALDRSQCSGGAGMNLARAGHLSICSTARLFCRSEPLLQGGRNK